jgi:hypothetical protein
MMLNGQKNGIMVLGLRGGVQTCNAFLARGGFFVTCSI